MSDPAGPVASMDLHPATDEIAVDLDGVRLVARRGESLAACLAGAGILGFRTTRSGAERGIFCGMGVCQDCLVEVDGKANQRACMIKVDRPMTVRRERFDHPVAAVPAGSPPRTLDDIPVLRPDVLVVGAGPAGLSAAIAAAGSGARVLLLDERTTAGGQYFKQLAVSGRGRPDRQHDEGRRLIDEALRAGVELQSQALVWGAFAPLVFAASIAGRPARIEPAAAIVATGAYERAWPVPGWTLPGVMTTGAAQTLLRTAGRLPGRRILIGGNGPLNLQLASELVVAGATVVGIVESAAGPGLRNLADAATLALTSPRLAMDGIRMLATRRRAGVPLFHGRHIASIAPSPGGLVATLSGESGARIEADIVCLGYGFMPSNELLRAIGVAHVPAADGRSLEPVRGADGSTSVPGLFAAGDCTRIAGARVAMAAGTLAGLAAARHAGRSPDAAPARAARTLLSRHHRFQTALWSIFRATTDQPAPDPATIVCRCEEVTFADVQVAIGEGLTSVGAIKRRTRLGMGRCQGRYCAATLETMLGAARPRQRDEFSGFAPRVPARPIRIADLARGADES